MTKRNKVIEECMNVVPYISDDGEYADGYNACSKRVLDKLEKLKEDDYATFPSFSERAKLVELYEEWLNEQREFRIKYSNNSLIDWLHLKAY